jgi:hypothetical protein
MCPNILLPRSLSPTSLTQTDLANCRRWPPSSVVAAALYRHRRPPPLARCTSSAGWVIRPAARARSPASVRSDQPPVLLHRPCRAPPAAGPMTPNVARRRPLSVHMTYAGHHAPILLQPRAAVLPDDTSVPPPPRAVVLPDSAASSLMAQQQQGRRLALSLSMSI